MPKKEFANYCWGNGMVPITPRHGQGTNKSLHAQLKQCAAVGNKKDFCRLVEDFHAARMLTKQEARTIAAIVVRPATDETNRISDANAVIEKKVRLWRFCSQEFGGSLERAQTAAARDGGRVKSLKNGPRAIRFLNE